MGCEQSGVCFAVVVCIYAILAERRELIMSHDFYIGKDANNCSEVLLPDSMYS